VIFIDSNIPMYLVGASHPHKIDARRMLEKSILDERRLVTDAGVLQEILHRYAAISRRDAIQPAFEALLGAKTILNAYSRLSARDALHLAVMERHQVADVLTFDTGFDDFPGVRRISI
jgi:predicted nucleic acid-binding protein